MAFQLGHAFIKPLSDKPKRTGFPDEKMKSALYAAPLIGVIVTFGFGGGIAIAKDTGNGACPPGAAAKGNACQAAPADKKAGLIGQIAPAKGLHIVTTPGVYGLGDPPAGNSYAVIDGQLVRINTKTHQIMSIIRSVDRILD